VLAIWPQHASTLDLLVSPPGTDVMGYPITEPVAEVPPAASPQPEGDPAVSSTFPIVVADAVASATVPVHASSHVEVAWRAALFMLVKDATSSRDLLRRRSWPTSRICRRPVRCDQLLPPTIPGNPRSSTRRSSNA